MQCSGRKRDGKPCRSPRLRGEKFCYFHSGFAAAAGRVGGLRRKVFNPANLQHFARPENASDLLVIVTQTLVDARESKLDCRVASTVGSLAAVALQLMHSSSLEERISVLEGKKRKEQHHYV
jgi:hypothetical protein